MDLPKHGRASRFRESMFARAIRMQEVEVACCRRGWRCCVAADRGVEVKKSRSRPPSSRGEREKIPRRDDAQRRRGPTAAAAARGPRVLGPRPLARSTGVCLQEAPRLDSYPVSQLYREARAPPPAFRLLSVSEPSKRAGSVDPLLRAASTALWDALRRVTEVARLDLGELGR